MTSFDFILLVIFVFAAVSVILTNVARFAFRTERRGTGAVIWSFFGVLLGVTIFAVPIEHQMERDSWLVGLLAYSGAVLTLVSSFFLASALDRQINLGTAPITMRQRLAEWAPIIAVPICLLFGPPASQYKNSAFVWLPPLIIILTWHVVLVAIGPNRFRRTVFALWNVFAFLICWITEQKGWP